MGRWAACRERDKGCRGGGGSDGGGEGDWGCVGRCELCGTVIKASLRRKCRTIYRRARRSIITTLMNGDTHALLIATSYYVPFMINSYTLFVQSEGMIDAKWCYINIFSCSLWLACFISIMCTACSIKIPRSLSLRLIILSFLVTGMLMTYVFSSTPISSLANKGHSISLTNL